MTRYWFENWKDGKVVNLVMELANSVTEAVSVLSGQYKGVFLLVSEQTEEERNQENLKELERVCGE